MNNFEQLGQFGNTLAGFSSFANQNFNFSPKHEVITVSSYEDAKNFRLNKGDTYDLLDPNADILYLKERDAIGRETMRIYKLQDITSQFEQQCTPANISQQEYNSLVNKIDSLINRIERGEKNAVKKPEQPELISAD